VRTVNYARLASWSYRFLVRSVNAQGVVSATPAVVVFVLLRPVSRHPQLHFVVLTVHDDDERIFDAICAGASGYLLKKTQSTRLLERIREVVNGGAPMSPEVAARVLRLFRQARPAPPANHELTPHEVRLLKLLVEGHNYRTAAIDLGVSIKTIAFHMRHIYEKLHVHSKSQAVSKALRDQIL
jgi:DNA-binding NarL/FixJ family response regulator